jgi:integrase
VKKMTDVLAKYIDLSAIDNAPLGDSTKERYKAAARAVVDEYGERALMNADFLSEYSKGLSTSGQYFLRGALKWITRDLANTWKSRAVPEDVPAIQAALWRLDAIREAVQTHHQKGKVVRKWLSADEVTRLLETCDTENPMGLRDWIAIALLVGGGLRRFEALGLHFDDVVDLPNHGGRRCVLRITGKGDVRRTVPIQRTLADNIRRWQDMLGAHGNSLVLRAVDVHDGRRITDSLSNQGIDKIVNRHAAAAGLDIEGLHTLRRTYAQLGLDAGIPITQISVLLGHKSVGTTQKYLDLDIDLDKTISDFVPL